MPRLTFWQIFQLINPNTLVVLRPVKIGPATFDAGQYIIRGQIIAGIDFFNYTNGEIEAEEESGRWVVKKVYATPGQS